MSENMDICSTQCVKLSHDLNRPTQITLMRLINDESDPGIKDLRHLPLKSSPDRISDRKGVRYSNILSGLKLKQRGFCHNIRPMYRHFSPHNVLQGEKDSSVFRRIRIMDESSLHQH